jgi:hypothetical protein
MHGMCPYSTLLLFSQDPDERGAKMSPRTNCLLIHSLQEEQFFFFRNTILMTTGKLPALAHFSNLAKGLPLPLFGGSLISLSFSQYCSPSPWGKAFLLRFCLCIHILWLSFISISVAAESSLLSHFYCHYFILPVIAGMKGRGHYAWLFSFEMGILWTSFPGWPGTMIFSSASKVARITVLSHQHPARSHTLYEQVHWIVTFS